MLHGGRLNQYGPQTPGHPVDDVRVQWVLQPVPCCRCAEPATTKVLCYGRPRPVGPMAVRFLCQACLHNLTEGAASFAPLGTTDYEQRLHARLPALFEGNENVQ